MATTTKSAKPVSKKPLSRPQPSGAPLSAAKPAKLPNRKSARLTVDLGSENLYKAIRILAIEQRRTVRDVVSEALRQWVEAQEEKEDLAAYRQAKDEPTIPWEEVEAEIRGLEASERAQ